MNDQKDEKDTAGQNLYRSAISLRFCDLASVLKELLFPKSNYSNALISLVDLVLRSPKDTEEEQLLLERRFNPLDNLAPETQRKIFSGTRTIPKKRAQAILDQYDSTALINKINELPDERKNILVHFFTEKGISAQPSNVGETADKVIRELISNLAHPKDNQTVYLEAIHSRQAIFEKYGFISEPPESIPVPEKPAGDETLYVEAILEAYAEQEHKNEIKLDDLGVYPKLAEDFNVHRNSYYSAIEIERGTRDIYGSDETAQFDVLKDEIFHGVRNEYLDTHDSGMHRLRRVLNQAASVTAGRCLLTRFSSWVGSLQKQGVCHVLVNEGRIKSWVDPDA